MTKGKSVVRKNRTTENADHNVEMKVENYNLNHKRKVASGSQILTLLL
jgi:hypothetical protein